MTWWMAILIVYLLIINLVGFALMGIDKQKAKWGVWRTPEKKLFLPALLGGTIGSICGMRFFRHKTKHWYFWYGLPALLVVQLVLIASIWYYYHNLLL